MGVPGFFRDLAKTYPHIIRNSVTGRITHLFLDCNCLLHPQCFKVLALNINETDQDRLFEKMWERIRAFIDYLDDFINPSELFYTGVDGVAPEAKISQQRQRRFGYANNYRNIILDKYDVPHNGSWSNIVITPGTNFMFKLHQRMKAHFAKKSAQKIKGKTCDYVYSSYMTPGEGEHKILQYIKTNISKDHDGSIVIYGLDADLIFLAMASQYQNLFLLREADQLNQTRVDHDDPTNVTEELLFVDIDLTKESINIEFNNEFKQFTQIEDGFEDDFFEDSSDESMDPISQNNEVDEIGGLDDLDFIDGSDSSNRSKQVQTKKKFRFNFCNDYIFICYFLGNDFLPHLPSVDIKVNGMKMVIDSYMTIVERKADVMIKYDQDGQIKIDSEFMYEFICSLAAKEDNFFRSTLPDHLSRMRRRRCYESEKHKRDIWAVENLKSTIDGHGKLTKLIIHDPIRLGEGEPDAWKYRYYEHYFHADYRQDEMIDKICENYVEGLYWVARYYFEECPTWRWQYKYAHAPFLSDIMSYLERTDIMSWENGIEFQNEPPLDMYTQLVSVIPQKYSHILPYELQSLSGSANSPVIDMYPQTYPVDMINKTVLYKCVPHIPYLDVKRIEDAVARCRLTKQERNRASSTDDLTFKRIGIKRDDKNKKATKVTKTSKSNASKSKNKGKVSKGRGNGKVSKTKKS
jgi:5'-3' exonuclease